MPDKRKKKTREDAIELLKQRAANNGLKNQAQQGANFEKANRPRQSVSTSQSANSSTTPRNTTQSTMRGSQSPSAVNSLFKETARKATGNGTASGNTLADRRQRYSQQRDKSTIKTPTVTRRNSRGQETTNINRTRSLSNTSSMNNLKRDTGRWARNEAYGALTGLNADLASTVDFLLPDVITPKAVQRGIDYYKNANETQQKKVQALRGNSRTREIVGNIGVNAIQQIPTATMAMLSGGTSLAAEAAPTLLNPSTLTHTGNVVTRALGQVAKDTGRNPMFWETFLRTAGNTYDNEIRNGASPTRATLSAYANGLLNAQIEVGGGVEVYDPSETFLKAIARSAKEEGLEEVQQYAVENLVNKAIGSNNAKWFSMNRGDNAVVNPVDMLEQGAYGAIGGGLASGGRVAMAKAMADAVDTRYANAHPDIQGHAQNLIRQAQVQGRTGERMSNSERLANAMQDQMNQGVQVSPRQVRELESALRVDQTYNAQDYERRNREQYQQAVSEGRADRVKQQGTLEERQAANSKLDETITRNYERAKAVMGENASEQSVKAVANVMTGSTDNADIDTVLMDTEAKKAVEKLSDVKLSANNQAARTEIENLALTHQIENRDTILKEAQETVRTERKNMSKRGGELFDENYDHAMEVLNVPNRANIYESFFSRFYTDGTVKGANFDDSYNRIMSNVREDFGDELAGRIGEVFNLDFAQKVFTQGQMAQAAYNAKYQGKTFALKASENPAGFTYEDSARAKISDKQADLLKKFAERANVHIRLVDSIEGGRANGKYEDGVIVIAADTSNKLVTVAKHELTHHIRSTSPELYQKLEDFIFNKYYEWDADALENKIREYQARGYKMTAEKIKEEIVADASESFFTDKGSIQAVVDHDRGLAQAIHDGIKTLLDTLLDLQESDNLSRRGYGDFLDDIGVLREAEKMWLDALNDTVEKTREARPSADDYTDANAFDPTDYKFSLVEDKDEIRRLNAEPSQKTYRAMALIDGKLYPPMSTKVKGEDGKWKLNTGLDIGQWIESDITTDHTMFNKEGKFILKKDNGDTIYAAYNPYIHSSDTMLNDQFSTAYKRPNIVVVEGNIPTSELSNGYRAEHDLDNGTHITAKDTTGVIEWKAGVVQGKLTGTRTVYLTQHFKPVRVVPDSEVAKHIQDMVKGTDVVIPYNVVTPNLREELLKLGVDMAQSEDKKYQVDLNTKFSTKEDQGYQENDDIRYSLSSSFEAVGCDIRKENGMIKAFDSDGVEITEFKPSYIRKSPLGRLLSLAVNKKILTDSDVTQQTQFLSRLYNMILNTQDPDLIWAVSGTIGYDPKHGIGKDSDWLKESKSKFASITGNSDPQYDTTIDFTTICVKTQAIIDAMSKLMIDLGRGLTEHEIIDIVYKETARAGEQVPCPVCYVFSRWVGLGNLFGKIKQFQQDYPEDMDMTEVRKEYEKIKKQVDKLVSEQKGKKSGTKAREQLYAETIERKDLLDLKRQMPNKKLTEAEEKEIEAINNRLEILDHWSWLEKTRLADDYKAVPDDVLFDLNAGRTFAMDYPATWRFRTTRGPSLGKAVAPYSPSRLGDTIRGIASPSTLGKLGNSNRVFLNKNGLSKTARNAYNKAIENAKRQNRMNGQRLQSTSDFRFEYGLDYLLSFIELEAIGAKAQMYTKVPEAVKFLASTGTEVNCSVMAKGSGVVKNRKVGDHYIGIDIFTGEEIETDQEYSLVFSDITGMSIKDALALSRAYNNVQPILVGISRAHMIAAMANKYITMIIPFHSSGSSEGRYRSMMEAVGEAVEGRTPFEEYENEHDIENATPEQKLCRKLRVDILTGKFKDAELTDKEQQALKNNEILRQLFIRIYGKDINGKEAKPNKKYVENFDENGNDADCYGVYLTKKQAGVMMPYEYWDKHSTIKDADKQGEAYVKYCESLGITPVFSGWDSKGKYHEDMDFSSYPGYWKTLIDRKMYNNDGTYHKQQAVNVKNVDLDMLDSNAMKDGIFKPMQTQNTEKTQTIVERSKATIAAEAPETKFQLKDLDSKDTIASQNTISKLEEQVKDLKAEFKRTDLKTADQKQARIQAGKLIQRHGSNMGVQKDLTDTFNKIFRLYKEKGTEAFDEVYEIAKDAAVNVVNNITEVHNEGREEYDAIKQYLRETPITISEDMKRNITDYNDFRKRNFGRLKLKNGETSNIDNVYMELSEMFPEQFTDDYVNPHDQLNHIVDVLDNFAPYYETLDGASEEMQDYVVDIASDIMETAYGLQTKKTFADKKYLEKEAAVKKAREKALESRNKALERQKTRYEKQIGELKQKNQDFKEQTRENAEKKRRIKQIANIHKRLLEKLQTNNDAKHLPDGYAPIVSKVLKMFDFTTPGMEKWAERNGEPSKRYRYMMELRKQLQEMSENESGIEVDNDLIDLVDELTADIGESQRLADLDSRVLEDIATLFRAFEHQINSYNKMFVEGKKQTITEAAYRAFDEMRKDNKWKLGVMGRLMASNFNPSDFFTLIGGEIEDLYNSTRKGFDKYVRNMDDAREFIQSTVNNKAADKWANHTGTYKTASGEEVKLTDTQLMDLYVSSRREQAQGHIFFGGIISAPVKVKGKLKATELEEKRVIPTQEDLTRWFGNLSKEQIKVAEAMQKYLTEVPSEWGNETSMIMYNYRKFGEKMYWPIQSSADYRDSNFDQKGNDPTLKNISPSKAVVEGANNAIVIDDIFTVFCKHIAQMASYNAYVPAISDFQRVWNFSEGNDRDKVKARFKEAYGKAAADYVEDFFKNLNGSYKNNFDVGIFDKGLGLFKKAAVGGNIRVLVQQPTAIARAALIVNPAYLAASIPSSAVQNKKVYQEMMEHCPIAKWKVWGFYSSDITSASRDLKNIMIGKEAFTDKIFMDMYGKADNVTWTVIFNACKMQVEAQNKGLKKGSDEYWEKVNDLASRVFDRTQVVDSPFHRSKIMKSQDKLVKMATSFLAEPTKTVNMLNTEMTLAMRELRAGHHGRAAGIFTRVGTVFVANAALLAVAQALVDAMRHTGGDDDKDKGKYKDRWLAYWKDNFKENMEILGMVPILKDVKSLWDGYDVARMDMSGVQKVIQSIQYLKKYYENPEESKYTEQEEWMNLGLTAMYAAGVPISNAKRDIEAAILTGAEATNNPNVALWFMKRKYQVNSKTKSFWIGSYFNAIENGNEGLARNIKKYIASTGEITDEDIEKAANKRCKDNPTEEDKARIEKSQQTLEGSNIWKTSSDKDKERYSGYLEKIALEIEDTNTNSITKYATDGLTNEQVVLFKLALRKADAQNNNNGGYDNDEKKAALKMLERNYKFTEKQKKVLMSIKS